MCEFHSNYSSHHDERTFNLEWGLKRTGNVAKNHVDRYRIKDEMFTFLLDMFTNTSCALVVFNVTYANYNTFPLHLEENRKSNPA